MEDAAAEMRALSKSMSAMAYEIERLRAEIAALRGALNGLDRVITKKRR